MSAMLANDANGLRSVLRRVYHGVRLPMDYMRARRILKIYTEHHQAAQRVYESENQHAKQRDRTYLSRLRVKTVRYGSSDNFIELPDGYPEIISRLAGDFAAKFALSENCFFFPRVGASNQLTN